MEIEREINGKTVSFKLTEEELQWAYFEQQHIFDSEDILSTIEYMDDDEIEEMFDVTRQEFEDLVPEMADALRSNLDKYDMPFDEARIAAIKDVIGVYSI